jgi:hypothetical protein
MFRLLDDEGERTLEFRIVAASEVVRIPGDEEEFDGLLTDDPVSDRPVLFVALEAR